MPTKASKQLLVLKVATHRVHNGNSVVEAEHQEQRPTEGEAGQKDVPDPLQPLHLCVVGCCCVATDAGSQGIEDYQGCEEGPSVVRVEGPHTCQREDKKG